MPRASSDLKADIVPPLPSPDTQDVWERLASCNKPVCIYGTGNGADKIMDVLAERRIPVAGVFASDGFVRDREFRGFRVLSYDEACACFGDFTAVLAFGTHRADVIAAIKKLASERLVLCPDVPVFGDGLFDRKYYTENYGAFVRLYDMLADDESRRTLSLVLASKLTGDLCPLFSCGGDGDIISLARDIFPYEDYRVIADLGAYTGDTVRKAAELMPNLERIFAFEPEPHAYKKLAALSEVTSHPCVLAYNAAAWECDMTLEFTSGSGRGSSGTGRAHRKTKTLAVNALALDGVMDGGGVDFIKLDVEGAEAEALRGASDLLFRCQPDICVSVYHRTNDMLALPELVNRLCPEKRLFLRRELCLPAWGTTLCAVD